MPKVAIINNSPFELPKYETTSSAGVDLRAVLTSEVKLASLERKVIGTGIKIALPKGYEAQVRSRSGLSAKHGITVLNSPGTIDSDYRGEIGVILVNISSESYIINPGDRIAQLVFAKVEQVKWDLKESLDITSRGVGGFGSTGK